MTVTFKAPYGTADQHVTSPAQHFGYRYIVAYLVDGGSKADYIRRVCADAYAEQAPKDAVCRVYPSADQWKQRGDITVNFARTLDAYAAALTRYEQELKAERRQEGS